MQVIDTIDALRPEIRAFKREGKTVGFVPTMGALHEGHLSLFRLALQHCDELVVSIYVNPTQFGPNEDLDKYPRQMERDLQLCEKEGASVVFTPSDEVMYSDRRYLSIQIDELADHMCGASRDSHFEGVLLVVNKLFNIVDPDVAAFGQKDIQQYVLIERMVDEFNHSVKLLRGEIIRANDGLALSSRNAYLNDTERATAPGLYRALGYLKKQIEDGITNVKLMVEHQQDELEAKGFKIDYLGVYAYESLSPVTELSEGSQYIIAGAVYLGKTRLIDNMIIQL